MIPAHSRGDACDVVECVRNRIGIVLRNDGILGVPSVAVIARVTASCSHRFSLPARQNSQIPHVFRSQAMPTRCPTSRIWQPGPQSIDDPHHLMADNDRALVRGRSPSITCRSVRQTAQQRTRTRTSPSCGWGSGTSAESKRRQAMSPLSSSTIAFIAGELQNPSQRSSAGRPLAGTRNRLNNAILARILSARKECLHESKSPGSGGNKLMLGMADGEDGARRLADDLFGHASHKDMRQSGAPVRPDHDQIDVRLFRVTDDLQKWRTLPHRANDRFAGGPSRLETPARASVSRSVSSSFR